MMRAVRTLVLLAACGLLNGARPAGADVVSDWNVTALQATVTGARPGPSAVLDLATVHAAMHDAIQAYERRFESYSDRIKHPSGSKVAAAAAAAHGVLVARFPAQAATLNTTLQTYLTGLGLAGDTGIAIGQLAAEAVIAKRAGDGSFPSNPEVFTGGTGPGEWRPSLPAFAPMATPWMAMVVPFTLKEPTQFRAPAPPSLTSGRYTREYNEVLALGRITNSARTQEQTDLALFYSDNFLALWERTLRGLAITDVGINARMFALANMAAADSVITAWDNKRYWNYWRPLTAILEGENDGNPDTKGDPTWRPYLPTPPYPDYTSGANNVTGSITRILALLFGDKTTFSVFSTLANRTMTYERFSDAAADVVEVRIYQGIHFRTADRVARRQGQHAADWAFSHFLRPLHHHHHHDDDHDHD
jgi:hypothetical protein